MQQSPTIWTVLSMLEWATEYFEKKSVKSPRLSIEWLLAFVLQKKRLDLYLCYDQPLTSEELDKLRALVKRRSLHEPLQYIVGKTTFYNAEIGVNKNVLIPRQETEQLVQIILDKFTETTNLRVLDVGTGSGCIPVALKMERPDWQITATDISEEALALAAKNATLNNVEISFVQQDLFNPVFENSETQFDLIISNPPYVLKEDKDGLDKEVREYEPHLALFCENTEAMFTALEKYCSKYLANSGSSYFEIHENEGAQTAQVFSNNKWKTQILEDYDMKERFLLITR